MTTAPNLASRPFVNRRPIRRLTGVLWTLALALLAVDGWIYWVHFAGQGRQQTELEELEAGAAEERGRLQDALLALEDFDLDWQLEQVTFLNAKIAERTFSWSSLFDDLSEVLPRNVRVERVTPQQTSSAGSRRRGGQRQEGDEVILEFTGAAEEDEALLVLLDAFFAHERFRRPNLKVETRDDQGNHVAFSMTVSYSPGSAADQERAEIDTQPAAETDVSAPSAADVEPEVSS